MIKRRALEITLERLAKPEKPKPEFEQYTTPADVAGDMLWTALTNGDIQDRKVVDLGCGNGILGIGAALLGASSVHCYDIDPKMIELCKQNAASAGVNIIADSEDALMVNGEFDTTIQNPPFGAQNPGADRPFLRTAVRISKVAYSLHNAETINFVAKFCNDLGADVIHIKNYKFKIPFMFEFHNQPVEFVYVSLLRITPRR